MAASYSQVTQRSTVSQGNQSSLANLGGPFGTISKLPRPRSVRISIPPGEELDIRSFYAAVLKAAQAKPISICRSSLNDVILTFGTAEESTRLLQLSSFLNEENGKEYEVNDPVSPIVNVQVLNIPYELSDQAIIRKLSVYGEVLGCRRGHHPYMHSVENGVRHLRVKLRKPVPSFIHFGSESFPIRYAGMERTCRRCDENGHQARECKRMRCFNCSGLGHSSRDCQEAPMCQICGDVGHKSIACSEWVTDFPDQQQDPQPETTGPLPEVEEKKAEEQTERADIEMPVEQHKEPQDPNVLILVTDQKEIAERFQQESNLQKLVKNTESLAASLIPPVLGKKTSLQVKKGPTASEAAPQGPTVDDEDGKEEGELSDSTIGSKRGIEEVEGTESSSTTKSKESATWTRKQKKKKNKKTK